MIEIRNLTRHYGDTVAVQGVSTEIRRGEIVGLLGHNGAGKTTVMKILTGYLDPTEGSVRVDGLDLDTDRAAAQQRIGYLPENAPLYDEMRVQDYLQTMAALRGVPPGDLPQAVADAVDATDLRERLDAPIGTLSKGLRQRVGIAQAILHRPDVLVLDEPTNGLDPTQIRSIRALIRRLGQTSTILLSTHILQEIEAVCDRVLIMIRGELVADAPLAELLDAHSIHLALALDAQQVEPVLAAVPGITAVRAEGTVNGWAHYTLRWSGTAAPVQAVVEAALAQGWTLGAIAPEQRTLERVFSDLQRDHLHAGGAA